MPTRKEEGAKEKKKKEGEKKGKKGISVGGLEGSVV